MIVTFGLLGDPVAAAVPRTRQSQAAPLPSHVSRTIAPKHRSIIPTCIFLARTAQRHSDHAQFSYFVYVRRFGHPPRRLCVHFDCILVSDVAAFSSCRMADSEAPTKPTTPPRVNNPQETSIDVWWDAVPGATGYVLQIRTFPKPWDEAREEQYDAETRNVTVGGLLPTSTYQFRLVSLKGASVKDLRLALQCSYPSSCIASPPLGCVLAGDQRSEPSEAASGDTLEADCTPKTRCLIM